MLGRSIDVSEGSVKIIIKCERIPYKVNYKHLEVSVTKKGAFLGPHFFVSADNMLIHSQISGQLASLTVQCFTLLGEKPPEERSFTGSPCKRPFLKVAYFLTWCSKAKMVQTYTPY